MTLYFLQTALEFSLACIILQIYPQKSKEISVHSVGSSSLSDLMVFVSTRMSEIAPCISVCLMFTLPGFVSCSSKGISASSQIRTICYFPSKSCSISLLKINLPSPKLLLFWCIFNVSHLDNRLAKGSVQSPRTFAPQPLLYAVHSSCIVGYFDGST